MAADRSSVSMKLSVSTDDADDADVDVDDDKASADASRVSTWNRRCCTTENVVATCASLPSKATHRYNDEGGFIFFVF